MSSSVRRSNAQDYVKQLELLRSASVRLSSTLDLDTLLEDIVSEVAETFGCTRSAVLLLEPDGRELVLVAVRGWTTRHHPKGFRFRVGKEGLVGRTAYTGEVSYVPDVRKDPAYLVSEDSTFPVGKFVTMIYGVLNIEASLLSIAVAGHPPPILIQDAAVDAVEIAGGLPLGIASWPYEATSIAIEPRSSVLLYSDGVLEAENLQGEEFGMDRLKRACRARTLTPESMIGEAVQFASPKLIADDATVMIIRHH